jgi:hypothetical protein
MARRLCGGALCREDERVRTQCPWARKMAFSRNLGVSGRCDRAGWSRQAGRPTALSHKTPADEPRQNVFQITLGRG